MTKKKLLELGWEILPHPPYSPDLAPSDYQLFRSLHNHLREKHFDDRAHLETALQAFFASKTADFYARGIEQLCDRWHQVVDLCGEYIID